jgi:hypothetical protein
MWIRGGRLTFSLLKAIPPSFALHKAKAPPARSGDLSDKSKIRR